MSKIIINIASLVIDLMLFSYSIYLMVIFFKYKEYKERRYSNLIIGVILFIASCLLFTFKTYEFVITNFEPKIKWSIYNDKEGNFSILFPDKITEGEEYNPYGNLTLIESEIKNPKLQSLYTIKYLKNSENEKIIDNSIRYDEKKDLIIYEKKESNMNNYHILEYKMITKDKKYDMIKKYIYNDKIIYIITVIGSPISEENANKFFDSFQILR